MASLDLDVTTDTPLTQLAIAPAATKVSCFNRTAGKNQIEVYTYIWWPGESDILESMLSTGAFQKEAIPF